MSNTTAHMTQCHLLTDVVAVLAEHLIEQQRVLKALNKPSMIRVTIVKITSTLSILLEAILHHIKQQYNTKN